MRRPLIAIERSFPWPSLCDARFHGLCPLLLAAGGVAQSDWAGDQAVLLADDLDEQQPLMNVPHDCAVQRDAASLSAAMKEMLRFSCRATRQSGPLTTRGIDPPSKVGEEGIFMEEEMRLGSSALRASGPRRDVMVEPDEQKIVREIMVFLHSHEVGTARAVRIYKTYGVDAVQVMTENPYRLARDIRGIGFKTADAIAMKLGVEKIAMIRVRAGISYALTEAMDDGHCGLPRRTS
jgi:hypothetical protein